MKTKYFLSIVSIALIVAMTSCSGKLRPLASEYVKTTPQPLEVVGEQVPVTIDATYPAKWFNKKAVVTVIPVLRYQGGETWGTSYTFQGEKVRGNGHVINYKEGGNVTMRSSFNYKPEMKKAELFLTFDAKIKNKEVQIPEVKIADGVIATAAMADARSASPALAPDKFQRIIKEAHDANIMFLIQQAGLRSNELRKEELKDWKNLVKNADETPNQNVSIEISAYASPDGGLDLNEKLAERREHNTKDYLNRELRRQKIKDVAVDTRYTAQDWEGFKELVEQSNLQDKDLVLRVLSMYNDPEQREQEIKNISSVFKQLAEEVLPQLRRSRLTANIEIIGKSDEEIATLSKEAPNKLNVEELLYSATLSDNAARKEAIYRKVTELYPKDYRAYNNIGMLKFRMGDLNGAEQMFNKSNKIQSNPEASMNLGLIALANGDKDKATEMFGKAGTVPEFGQAMGVLQLKNGEYEAAVKSFGETKSNNAALAQILTKDYNKAQQTLDAVQQPNEITHYLKAVIAARTNNVRGAIENLRMSIEKDSTIAKEAAKDLEFAKYLNNADFVRLIRQ